MFGLQRGVTKNKVTTRRDHLKQLEVFFKYITHFNSYLHFLQYSSAMYKISVISHRFSFTVTLANITAYLQLNMEIIDGSHTMLLKFV